jgi:hypothetical protein
MRTRIGFCLALFVATTLSAQNRGGGFVQPLPGVMTTGSVVHPGGTSGMPGVQRTTGSVVHPGGSSTQIGIPGARPAGRYRNGTGAMYAYPVYVPAYGYGYGAGYDAPPAEPAPVQQAQPNVIVIYPPAPAPAPAQVYYAPSPRPSITEVAPQEQPTEPTHYLLAFKDHSIYSAVAYWVDGDTLHYFTNGNTHNQASLALVDRALTKKLNDGSGLEVKLPAAK